MERLTTTEQWLADLDTQFLKMPKKRTEMPQQQARGEWPTYEQLVSNFAAEKAAVMTLNHEGSASDLTVQQARRVHDALLCCMMIGWLPPPRITVIITLVGPEPKHAR